MIKSIFLNLYNYLGYSIVLYDDLVIYDDLILSNTIADYSCYMI